MLLGTQAFRATSSFADTKRRPSRRLRHSTLSGTLGEPDFQQFRTGVRGESPTRVVKALSGMNSQAERWTLLTSHARVLLTLARDPTARLRDIAAACRITERTVLAIVTDLEQAPTYIGNASGHAISTPSTWTDRSGTQRRPTCPSASSWNSSPAAKKEPHHPRRAKHCRHKENPRHSPGLTNACTGRPACGRPARTTHGPDTWPMACPLQEQALIGRAARP